MDKLSSEPRTTEDLNSISVTDNPVLSAIWALKSVKMIIQVRSQHFRSLWTSNPPTIWTTEDLNNISVTDNPVLSAIWVLRSVKMVIQVRRQHFRSNIKGLEGKSIINGFFCHTIKIKIST